MKYGIKSLFLCIVVTGALFSAQVSFAASNIKNVSGFYTYYGDQNDSPAMCKAKALEGARIDALSKEFGTIVSQDVMQSDHISSSGEINNFLALSSTEVKGEWIANSGDPVYKVSLSSEECLIVSCSVTGTAKAISNEAADFEAVALRNGIPTTEYMEGDDLFVKFSAPVDGYAAIFLMEQTGKTYKMLPYSTTPGQEIKIKKGYDYVFFDASRASGTFGEAESLQIATNGEIEFNKLYVFFSPNAFSMPNLKKSTKEYELPYMDGDDFSKWHVKMRHHDPKMNVKTINLKLIPLKN